MTKYEIKHTTQFKKDYKLAKRRGLKIYLVCKKAGKQTLPGLYSYIRNQILYS